MSSASCGMESYSHLPVKNINVEEAHEGKMGLTDQEAREVIVGVKKKPLLGTPSLPSPPIHSLPANHREWDGDFPVAEDAAASAGFALTSSELLGGGEERIKRGMLEASSSSLGQGVPRWPLILPTRTPPLLLAKQWLIFHCLTQTERSVTWLNRIILPPEQTILKPLAWLNYLSIFT